MGIVSVADIGLSFYHNQSIMIIIDHPKCWYGDPNVNRLNVYTRASFICLILLIVALFYYHYLKLESYFFIYTEMYILILLLGSCP